MAEITLTIGSTDLSTLGLHVIEPNGLWDALARRREWERRVNRNEALDLTTLDQVEPRAIFLRAAVVAASLAALDTALDEIKWRFRGRAMQIEMTDRARILNVVRAGPIEIRRLQQATVRLSRELVIPLEALDPVWYDKTNQTPSLSTTQADTPLGTAEVEKLVVSGLGGTETIEYRNSASTVLKTFGYTGIASTPVTVDFGAMTVVDNGGAGQADKIDDGSEFFRLDPNDGNFVTSAWPKLRLTTGTGTATYARAWE